METLLMVVLGIFAAFGALAFALIAYIVWEALYYQVLLAPALERDLASGKDMLSGGQGGEHHGGGSVCEVKHCALVDIKMRGGDRDTRDLEYR